MPKLPVKFPSTRVKSPAARPRPRPSRRARSPSPPPSTKRSQSHDHPSRRPSQSNASSRYPPSTRRPNRRTSSPHPRRRSPDRNDDRHARHRRRRDSSSSPERFNRSPRRVERDYLRDDRGRQRPSSYAPGSDARRSSRDRRSSTHLPTPPRVRPGSLSEDADARRDHRRSSMPDKYRPDKYKDKRSPSPRTRPSASEGSGKDRKDASPSKADAKPEAASHSSSASNIFSSLPMTFATHAGISAVTKHAETAKEWVSWLNDLNETPEEIQAMSAKATTARDTISQVQQTIKARPDLLEDEVGQQLKEQIEEAIESTDKALGKMSKLLSEISKKGAKHGNAIDGIQDFWRSYRYKDEFEGKVKEANDELQKELGSLSTLMVNVYSRSLMKPAPAGSSAVPPPAPSKETVEAAAADKKDRVETKADDARDQTEPSEPSTTTKKVLDSARPPVPKIIEPESDSEEQGLNEQTKDKGNGEAKDKDDDNERAPRPPASPSTVAFEETKMGSPPQTSSEKKADKTGGLPTPPPAGPGDNDKPPREARGSVSEEQAQDDLLDAAWDGDIDAAAQALRHVSHSCCDMRGLTPLHLAAERDHLAVAILLLDRGADIHSRSDGGRTPLHLAARSATSSMVETLLERARADPNAQTAKGRTPLHYAASKAEDGDEERREVIRVLRDSGADPTVVDKEGETARDVAQKREHWDAAATLRRAEKKWEEDHKQNWLQRHGFTS